MAAPTNGLHLVTWYDVFVLIDHGGARPADYAILGNRVIAQAATHAGGIGGLTIIPPNATPPSDDVRVAMNEVMHRLGSSLRCLCWLVEGSGFQGAMARAVLTGVQMFGRLPYASHVETDANEALAWIVRHLDRNDGRIARVPEGVRWIEQQRRRLTEGQPPRGA